jgi:hypothetical protein
MTGDALDFLRDLARGKRRIDKARANGAARHRIKFRASFILRESQSASCLDRTQTGCAVGATAR